MEYQPDTGKFFWRQRPEIHFKNTRLCKSFNKRFAGKECFTYRDKLNYLRGTLNHESFLAHRVAWAVHYGEWPAGMLDHIDGNPGNNKIENLRIATPSENQGNRKTTVRSSIYKGVYWCNSHNRWVASVYKDGKRIRSKHTDSEEDAALFYNEGAKEVFKNYARLN